MLRTAPQIGPRIRPQHRTVRARLPAWEIAVSLLGTVLIPRLEARLRRAVIARQRVFHRGCVARFSWRAPQWALRELASSEIQLGQRFWQGVWPRSEAQRFGPPAPGTGWAWLPSAALR